MICGPGQGLTGQMQADFQAGLGVVLAGTFYPTKSSADRQSIVRCYASENDYGTGLPVVEISMSDSHDLVFRVTETQVMLDARILAPLLGKPMTVVAVVRRKGETSYQMELEVNGSLYTSAEAAVDSDKTLGFQVLGCSGATFELRSIAITKALERDDRAKLFEYFNDEETSTEVHYSQFGIGSASIKYTASASPIESFPKRAVVDTNVLLDASLISDGFGAKALAALRGAGVSLYVDEIAYRDALRILQKHRHRTSITWEALEGLLVNCSSRHTILSVPPGDALHGSKVKQHDQHIARAAAALDAFVVTDDAPLLYQLFCSKIPAAMSRELALLTFGTHFPPPPFLIGGLGLGRRSSFIFARCNASPAIFNDGRSEATLWEGEDVGRFFYDAARAAFVLKTSWGPEVEHSFKMIPGRQIVLATTFDIRPTKTSIAIRAQYVETVEDSSRGGPRIASSEQFTARPSPLFGQRGMTIANSISRSSGSPNGWPGDIEAMTWGPGKLDAEAWKAYRAVVGTAPNPFTSDVVGVAISQMRKVGTFIRLPRFVDILAQVSTAIVLDESR